MLFKQLTYVMLNLVNDFIVHLIELFYQDMLIIQILNECELHVW